MHALSNVKSRLDRADTLVIASEKAIQGSQDLPKLRQAETKALPTYRAVLREATQEQASATDAELASGWSGIAGGARLRIHGASVINAVLSDNAITATEAARIGRVSKQVDAQNQRWMTVANRLNRRFKGCQA